MDLKNGLKPVKRDGRDFDFHRTFGAALEPLPTEYNTDLGLTSPNQNEEGAPYGCTGYTQSELCQDEDGVLYRPWYTYQKTCLIEGHDTTTGCDLRTSLKSTIVYGVQPIDKVTDADAFPNRRGQYFNVGPIGDWFEGIQRAMWTARHEKRAVSIGTPFFPEWTTPQDGILTELFYYDGYPTHYSWHNWKICGWKVIAGETYLVGKPWQGSQYGDKGFVYVSRDTINKIMKIRGCAAFTLGKARPEDVQTIKFNILEVIRDFLQRIIWLRS